ncbi:MAG TPA: hypothetical protein VH351_06150 [Bryobacteraceae bacterium]|nr:hypothetical protein [Bryobacteraceae bacterium]
MRFARTAFLAGLAASSLCVSVARANVVADSGPDQRAAFDVPVVLHGTGSNGTPGHPLTYLWQQVSGEPLEMIGQDRVTAMIISAETAGTFVFRLTVSDGTDTASDDMSLTVVPRSGRRLYVDNQLFNNTTTYSIANRNSSGTDGLGYKTIQEAADASQPGDTILIRGGTYPDAYSASGVYKRVAYITRSGTATAPIRYQNFNGEHVVLTGFGFEDRDLNNDGYADGPTYPPKRETLFLVEADYIQVFGLEFTNSQQEGLVVSGSFCYAEECSSHDNWLWNFEIKHGRNSNVMQGTVFRWVEGYRSRHANGFQFTMDTHTTNLTTVCAAVDGLFYNNGYQPDGSKVLPLASDPAGGGNSDGSGSEKYFADKATPEVDNWGPGNFIIRNINYHNADDGIDTSLADSLIEDNMSLLNGPEGTKGFKMLRNVRGMTYRGNLAYKNFSVGFELRPRIGTDISVIQNTSIRNNSQGILILTLGTNWNVQNNVCGFNGIRDFAAAQVPPGGRNWAKDGVGVLPNLRGDPQLVNDDVVIDPGVPGNSRVLHRITAIGRQIRQAFSPKPGSGLIDAGTMIPGYHCPRADDDPVSPMPKSDPRRHWYGTAPDIGAFEFKPHPSGRNLSH